MTGVHTVTIVKELGDVESTAGGPGGCPFISGVNRSHDVVLGSMPGVTLAVLGLVVRHTQHVT